MALKRKTSTLLAVGALAAMLSVGTAWAGGPDGAVEQSDDISQAVGSGVLNGALTASRPLGPPMRRLRRR